MMHGTESRRTDTRSGIVVVGAGLVGAVAALYLAPRFGPVTVLEKRADPRRGVAGTSRSLTVMLSARGWRVLRDLGLAETVRDVCLPLRGRCGHLPDGRTRVTPYSRDGQPIWSVERERLHHILLDAVEATPGARIRFGTRVRSVDLDAPAVLVEDREGRRRLTCRRVLGCDGAHSATRAALEERGVRTEVRTLELAYQEVDIPGGWLDTTTMHYWPTGDAMFAAFPLPSGNFSGALFMRASGLSPSYAADGTGRALSGIFAENFPEPSAAIPGIAGQLATRAVSRLSVVRSARWVWQDTFALLGDACHAMAPFMGHGMNCGFEDARTLVECLDANAGWATALEAYERSRVEDAEAISRLSYRHYFTMANPPREETPADVLRGRLLTLFPRHLAPLYERCAFTQDSYAAVLADDRRLELLVKKLLRRHGAALCTATDDRLRSAVPHLTSHTVRQEDLWCS